ncbi:MAG: hypothetical protein GX621_00770 [Pirellulaceae bacterium]|nr:hypothetical protein [Pirellulaceae bacterium]
MGTRRRDRNEANDVGQDSFLDIVANIVGILIILVMVMGVRAKHAPVPLNIASAEQAAARRELREDLATEKSLHGAVLRAAAEIEQLERSREARDAERTQLGLLAAAAEKMIEKRRSDLNSTARERFDLQRQLAEASNTLASLEDQYELAGRLEKQTVEIKNYPTPLSRTVSGQELHLQLVDGRVTVIPWEEIIAELKSVFEQSISRMRGRPEITSNTAPVGGFRIRYTIVRQDVSMRTYEETGRGGSYISLDKFSLVPVSNQMGEPLEMALGPNSELREKLAARRPERTTVTVWVYPSGFEDFRKLNEALHQMGYAVAGRPIPEGELIGGSPRGSRSSAQ